MKLPLMSAGKRCRKSENIDRLDRYLESRAECRNIDYISNQKELKSVCMKNFNQNWGTSKTFEIDGVVLNNMFRMLEDKEEPYEGAFEEICKEIKKKAISEGKKGVKQSDSHRLNNSLSKRGIKKEENHKRNISKSLKGNKNFLKFFDEDKRDEHSDRMKKYYENKRMGRE